MAIFSNEFILFFKELSKNNNRDWFHQNKKRYETHVKKPFYAFVEELLDKTKSNIPVKDAVFRINRDIRFSKDKRPYKNHVSAVISPGGRKNMQYPGLYVHLEVGNVMIGGGSHMPDKENLTKIRRAILNEPKRALKLLKDKKFVEYFGGLADGEKNKILPAEFKAHGDDIPLLFNKQYYFMSHHEDEQIILRDDLVQFVLDHLKAGTKWNQFLLEALDY